MMTKMSKFGKRNNTGKKYTLDEFFNCVYMPRAETRKRSWHIDARLARNHILKFFGNKCIGIISAVDVEDWLTNLRASGLAPATCNRILAVLKSAFSLAEALNYIRPGLSPCRQVRPLEVVPRKERFLSEAEGQRLMEYLRGDDSQQSKVIQILMLTGARKSEILNARWEDLDCRRQILTVPVAKSGKPRHIYLSEEAVAVFGSIDRRDGNPWIFPGHKHHKPLSSIYSFWNKTRKTLSLEGVRLHDLRHSYASYLVGSGHTLYETQQLLGHTDPRTTMRYAHFAHDTLVNAVACVGRILVKTAPKKEKKKRTPTWHGTTGRATGQTRHRHTPAIKEQGKTFGRSDS